jgi:proline iminopeptidase
MVDDLVQGHRYEQRGCGRSTGDPPYTVERWLDDLEQLRKHWQHPQWIVFGHSFGAELALAYAASFSSRARGVIYMSCLPAVLADRRGDEEFRASRAARIPEHLRARFDELWRLRRDQAVTLDARSRRRIVPLGLAAEIADPAIAAPHVNAMLEGAPPVNRTINAELGEDFRRYARRQEFLASLRQMQCPILVLHGDRDLRPMWAAEKLAQLLPDARLVKLPGGHFPWLEAPFELRRTLRTFVSDVLGAT